MAKTAVSDDKMSPNYKKFVEMMLDDPEFDNDAMEGMRKDFIEKGFI